MSRGTNQKFKFTYLMKIMLEKTDDEHSLTMPQIMEELEKYDVTAERKSIYTDFQDMTEKFGVEIIKEQIGREEKDSRPYQSQHQDEVLSSDTLSSAMPKAYEA